MLSTLASRSLESGISNIETKVKVYPYFVTLERFIGSDDQTRSFMSAIFHKTNRKEDYNVWNLHVGRARLSNLFKGWTIRKVMGGRQKQNKKKISRKLSIRKIYPYGFWPKNICPRRKKKTNLHVQKRDLASLKTLTPFPLNTFLIVHPWSIRLVPDGWWQFAPYIWFYSSSARCYLVLSVLCTSGKNNPF